MLKLMKSNCSLINITGIRYVYFSFNLNTYFMRNKLNKSSNLNDDDINYFNIRLLYIQHESKSHIYLV